MQEIQDNKLNSLQIEEKWTKWECFVLKVGDEEAT